MPSIHEKFHPWNKPAIRYTYMYIYVYIYVRMVCVSLIERFLSTTNFWYYGMKTQLVEPRIDKGNTVLCLFCVSPTKPYVYMSVGYTDLHMCTPSFCSSEFEEDNQMLQARAIENLYRAMVAKLQVIAIGSIHYRVKWLKMLMYNYFRCSCVKQILIHKLILCSESGCMCAIAMCNTCKSLTQRLW